MFMWLLARRIGRIRERREWPRGWGAVWFLIVLRLALFEFGVACFWAPFCVEVYEGFVHRRRRKLSDGRGDRETQSEGKPCS